MMGLEQIKAMNRDATRHARRHAKQPWEPSAADRVMLSTGVIPSTARLPFIGDYVPKGWKRVGERLFVDTSGFGRDDEPALSQSQLAKAMAKYPPGTAYALIEHGQFQGYVQAYKRA